MASRSRAALVLSVIACISPRVCSLVPVCVHPRWTLSFDLTDSKRPPQTRGDIRSAARRSLVCLSSPFEGAVGDNSEEDVDLVGREAQQLEEMIRGSRGVVIEAIEREWREEMLRVFREEGERLCLEAYEGYLDRGRGALFVNVDLGLSSSSKGHESAPSHAAFRSLEEVVMERSTRVKPADQMEIISRCQTYDPEEAFVVVFGHKGMLGVQVLRPSLKPAEVHRTRGPS